MSINGVVLVNKPTGMSSNSLVKRVGHALGCKKVGHLGTLDPMGCGLLPVLCGKATRLFDTISDKTKTYRAVFKFGIETDTLDSEGKITNKIDCDIKKEEIEKVLDALTGEIDQMPPQFSAKKVNGKKAYDLARSGEVVELKPKKVKISKLECVKQICKNTFLFEIVCSEGTYVRSICRDLSKLLSTCGVMCAICRTRCGAMQIKNATIIDEVDCSNLIEAHELIDLKQVALSAKFKEHLLNGKIIPSYVVGKIDGDFKLFCDNEFWGVARIEGDKVKIVRNFYGG